MVPGKEPTIMEYQWSFLQLQEGEFLREFNLSVLRKDKTNDARLSMRFLGYPRRADMAGVTCTILAVIELDSDIELFQRWERGPFSEFRDWRGKRYAVHLAIQPPAPEGQALRCPRASLPNGRHGKRAPLGKRDLCETT